MMIRNDKVLAMIKLIMMILIFLHWNGCIEFMISYSAYYPNFLPQSWLIKLNLVVSNTFGIFSVLFLSYAYTRRIYFDENYIHQISASSFVVTMPMIGTKIVTESC